MHLLAKMPLDKQAFDRIVARLKSRSSAAVRDTLPGRLWARGNKRVVKDDRSAQLQCMQYISRHADSGTEVWRFGNSTHRG